MTLPSFFPSGVSSSNPTQTPEAKLVLPTNLEPRKNEQGVKERACGHLTNLTSMIAQINETGKEGKEKRETDYAPYGRAKGPFSQRCLHCIPDAETAVR